VTGAHELAASFRLDGRVAVVIGGTGALGGGMAAALADAGASVVIVGRDPERGAEALERLSDDAREVRFEPCDAADRSALSLSREKCLEQIEMLQRQKAEIEEGLSELHRIYAQLSGKLGEGDGQRG